jgi:hypothetical protein
MPAAPAAAEPVIFAADRPLHDAALPEALRKLLAASPELQSGEQTLSNIPAILRHLLTPVPPAVPEAPAALSPAAAPWQPQDPDPALLAGWKPLHEYHANGNAQATGASRPVGDWQEMAGPRQPLDAGAEPGEVSAIIEGIRESRTQALLRSAASLRTGYAPGIRRPDAGAASPPSDGSSDADTDALGAAEHRGQPGASPPPARPRASREPTGRSTPRSFEADAAALPELQDTRPERVVGDPGPAGPGATGGSPPPWTELWPFPKFRQIVRDIPLLPRLRLRSSTVLLRPLLAAKLRKAHRRYLRGNVAGAAQLLDELCRSRSRSIRFWAHLLLGEIRLVHDSELDAAHQHVHEAARMSGRTGRAHLLLAITLYLQDQLAEARTLLETSRGADTPSPTSRLVLGLTLLELGELARGAAELEAARKRIQFPPELGERLRHARELLRSGLWQEE